MEARPITMKAHPPGQRGRHLPAEPWRRPNDAYEGNTNRDAFEAAMQGKVLDEFELYAEQSG